MRHTPGPWYVDDSAAIVYKDIGDERFQIAECASWSEETHPNAKLIAASPKLLEACRRMVRWAEEWKEGRTHPHDDWVFAKSAIAEATGETP